MPLDQATGVAPNTANITASFSEPVEPLTIYTGTITGATSVATGGSLQTPYVREFRTGSTPDTTRPSVTATVPATSNPGPTIDVHRNRHRW